MSDTAPWIGGILMALLALFGLILAGRGVDGPFQLFGLALFLFGLLAIFGLIARATRPTDTRALTGSRSTRPPESP